MVIARIAITEQSSSSLRDKEQNFKNLIMYHKLSVTKV